MSGSRRSAAVFKRRVRAWARKLDVEVGVITVRSMPNKWASFSTTGNLTFDRSLLEIDDRLCDCVIVHELLHVSVPNHGRLWKSLMRAHLGDYETLETQLKRLDPEPAATHPAPVRRAYVSPEGAR
jgi:predicted metal-dependent hydrolase